MDAAISRGTGLPVHIAEDPLTAVVRGAGILIDRPDLLKDVAFPASDRVMSL
jgi:rod shape-determining protein MreB and related proteins